MSAASRYFGSCRKAIEASGIPYDEIRRQRPPYTQDEILEKLRELQRNGVPLNWVSICNVDWSLANAMRRIFGSHKKAIEALGLDYEKVNLERLAGKHLWSDSEILEELKRFGELHELEEKSKRELSRLLNDGVKEKRERVK